jgi:branched-chain amino acid aminotransferase
VNVFEGLKGYWFEDGSNFGIVAMRRHYDRLQRSARLLYIPCTFDFSEFENACHELVNRLLSPDRDMWVRATLFAVEGYWGEETKADLVLTAYHQDKRRPAPIDVAVSTWQRSSDLTISPRIKTGANYHIGRLARIEGRRKGCSEMILLNQWGRVAEATGACVLMVRDGQVVTPPPTEGNLESITVQIVRQICRTLRIPFIERPIDRTELCIADEMALAGTLAEIVKIRRIDDLELPAESPILDAVSDRFWGAIRGVEPHEAIDLSLVPNATARKPIRFPGQRSAALKAS